MTEQVSIGKHRYRQIVLSAIMAVPLLTAGCNQKSAPSGQTIATVDGDEITTSDLQLEMKNVAPEQRKNSQPLVVQTLVDRKVLTQYAKSQGMDRNPDFVLQLRRMTDVLLAERAAQQIATSAQQPISANQVNDYLDTHPGIANRRILTMDQVTFPFPNTAVVKELGLAKTMADLVATLERHNIRFERNQIKGDTATLRDDLGRKLESVQPGEPLVILNQPTSTANVVIASEPAPLKSDVASAMAREAISNERANAAVQQRGLALRKTAKVTYAKGYAPPPASKNTR